MNSGNEQNRQSSMSGLTFFGKVTASVSHELNNVIAIIDQTGGLLQDLIIGEEQGVPISTERLGQAVSSIRKQTDRGLAIIKRLNRFAHSADSPIAEFDVNETVSNLVDLTRRLADLKRVGLEFKPYPAVISAVNNPFLLLQLLFAIIGLILSSSGPDDKIETGISGGETEFIITISGPGKVEYGESDWKELRQLSQNLGGSVNVESGDDGIKFSISLPARPQL